jgi:hypothetical protein
MHLDGNLTRAVAGPISDLHRAPVQPDLTTWLTQILNPSVRNVSPASKCGKCWDCGEDCGCWGDGPRKPDWEMGAKLKLPKSTPTECTDYYHNPHGSVNISSELLRRLDKETLETCL